MKLEGFRRNWSAEVLPRKPMILPARCFTFPRQVPGEEEELARGGLFVNVRPNSGGDFLMICALGFNEASLPSGVWTCPSPEMMLAVAGGYGYLVRTESPEHTVLLEQRPITEIIPAPEDGLLLLAGFRDVLALGVEGARWQSGRLSWEGLRSLEVHDGRLNGLGWDLFADREVQFSVDLRSGGHDGGGYRRTPR